MTARWPQPFARPRPLISVWPTGQLDSHAQLAEGCYVPETAQDLDRMPPAVAAHAIATYTRPGDTALDPDCGAGTVLTEALRSGRHAIGLTSQPRWWPVARANITAAKYDGATPDGMVLDHSPALAATRLAGLCGHITLILTALRPAASACQPGHGETESDAPAGRLQQALIECRPLLRPGGHIVVTVRPHRQRSRLLDLTGHAHEAARAAGLVPVERCVALLAELRGDRLLVVASMSQRRCAARHERATGHPVTLPTHHDVLIFRAPDAAATAAALRPPHLLQRPFAESQAAHDDVPWEAA